MASADHQNQQEQQHKHQVLKCPRCSSSNTKFCYYNNYNLSQPRHFCKACKRYWTKGGTLRNVPVGGGCRKNKRIKKQFSSTALPNPNPNPNPNNLDEFPSFTPSKSTNIHPLNPLFHGLSSSSPSQNPKYPRFVSRVSSLGETEASGFGLLHPQNGSLGLGLSSSYDHAHTSNSLLSSCPSMLSDPSMASLLASNLHQQPGFIGFSSYEDAGGSMVKGVQLGGTQNRMNWSNNFHGQNDDDDDQMTTVEASDPNPFLWTTVVGDGGDWLDPTNNIGFSVPSLI